MLTGMLFAFAGGLVVLEELDTHVAKLSLMTLSTMLSGIVTVFLVIAISSNKVEGMAVGKIAGLFSMTYFVPLVITGKIKYLFCVFPMFWIGEWSQFGGWEKIVAAFVLFVVWIYLLYWKLKKSRIGV